MENLHILTPSIFTKPYINFVNKNFSQEEHVFFIVTDDYDYLRDTDENVIQISKNFNSLVLLIKGLYTSKKVHLHSLFMTKVVILLYLQPWLLKKCYWVIWGADLYCYLRERKTIKSKVYESIRRKVIRNIGNLITHIKGDYELAKKWYRAKGKYYYSFMYPSNMYKEYNLSTIKKVNDKKYIQVGNSADPTNNHIEVFEKLLPFTDKNFEIICPLSYGDKKYANYVIQKGKEMFGEKFTPLTEFMPFEKYLEILAKIDIAIFNHRRQQAVGNITTLLSLGKKIYIRDDITTWEFCKEHGLKVYSTNSELNSLFEPMEENDCNINHQNIKKHFSEKNLIKDWNKIFDAE